MQTIRIQEEGNQEGFMEEVGLSWGSDEKRIKTEEKKRKFEVWAMWKTGKCMPMSVLISKFNLLRSLKIQWDFD